MQARVENKKEGLWKWNLAICSFEINKMCCFDKKKT